MKYEQLYEIEHIDLSNVFNNNEFKTIEKAKYLVFWWKDTAIGHLYLEPKMLSSANEFSKHLINAIKPAIIFYAQQKNNTRDWISLLQQKDWVAWHGWMNEVFTRQHPIQIPHKVAVSLIICTRNRPNFLETCLNQIENLACTPEEIIVVDNAPDNDDSFKVVKKFEGVIYVKEPKTGLSFARNTGVRMASQPLIAFTDDDVVVHPLWLYRVQETFENPSTAAMTGLVIASKLETKAQVIFEKFWSFNRGFVNKIYNEHYYRTNLKNGPPVWEIGAGANMAFRKDIFDQVGLFDELLGAGAAGCSEDSEMWFRILAKGYAIEYNPRAIVYHEHRRDLNGLKKQIYNYMRGFAVAAMAQQGNVKDAGYKNRVLKGLPVHYMKSTIKGFPEYDQKYRTLGVEVKGLISGILFYLKNKKKFLKFENKEFK